MHHIISQLRLSPSGPGDHMYIITWRTSPYTQRAQRRNIFSLMTSVVIIVVVGDVDWLKWPLQRLVGADAVRQGVGGGWQTAVQTGK
jgi:hypothetical protein